ncbi:MAG: dienelactone hydrolase family protein [Planctomycetota bacterium]
MRLLVCLGALLVTAVAAHGAVPEGFEERKVAATEDGKPVEFRYRLMRPATVAADVKYPLVLFLHGAGERGSDNEKQLEYLPTWLAEDARRQKYPCFALAPQCRTDRRWVEIDWSDKKSLPQKPEMTVDMTAAVAALDATMKTEPVDPGRVYLTGISMGGYGSWDLAARLPARFAAVIPICGGGDEATAGKLEGLPIWCFHGDADKAVPVERSRTMVEAVKAAGGKVQYTEYKGVGHDSWTPAYRDPATLDWLFGQKR